MKPLLSLLCLIVAAPLAALANTPEPVPLDRYEPLIRRSPFSPATASSAPAPTASFARDYYLTGVATVGGKAFITLSSRDHQTRFSLMEGETANGITFTGMEWAPGVGTSRAVLSKEGTTATVAFDEVAMKAAPVATPQPAAPANQAQFGSWRGRGEWGGRGRRGRGRGEDGASREQRQYMREQRRAWFRAMHSQQMQQAQQGQQAPQGQQGNRFQRPQPVR